MVVADARLVAGRAAGEGDPAREPALAQRLADVVGGLGRDAQPVGADALDHLVDARMVLGVGQHAQHGDARRRDAQTGGPAGAPRSRPAALRRTLANGSALSPERFQNRDNRSRSLDRFASVVDGRADPHPGMRATHRGAPGTEARRHAARTAGPAAVRLPRASTATARSAATSSPRRCGRARARRPPTSRCSRRRSAALRKALGPGVLEGRSELQLVLPARRLDRLGGRAPQLRQARPRARGDLGRRRARRSRSRARPAARPRGAVDRHPPRRARRPARRGARDARGRRHPARRRHLARGRAGRPRRRRRPSRSASPRAPR